jgi:transposase-like protein
VQRYQCKTCLKTFSKTYGTLFTGKRAFLTEGNRISTLAQVKGHKEDTILQWL